MKKKKIAALLLSASIAFTGTVTVNAATNQPAAGDTASDTTSDTVPAVPSDDGNGSAPTGGPASGTIPDAPPDGGNGSAPGGGSSSSSVTYNAATTISAADTQSGQTYTSTSADESALMVSTSDKVTLNNITVNKSGNSNGGDNCNFYGQNAALLVKGGSATTISGGTITSDASGANGVFSYGGNGGSNGTAGDGTTVNISDVTINTSGSGSGGIMTTGGGVTNATNLKVTTSGQSSAAIRTDRGGGTVTVNKGTYTSNGLGSPAIYSTADVSVSNATLVSNLSEGVCIEGKNSVKLTDCTLTANNTKKNGNARYLDTIMIYQSMSGDSSTGTSTFTMNGGTLNSKSGHVFHVTNTAAVINLNGVTINNSDSDNVLLSVANDGWSGASNTATLNASSQTLSGNIIVSNTASTASSSTSSLSLNLADSSVFTGTIAGASGKSDAGTVNVTIDSGSKWVLSGDSYVTGISGAGKVNYNGHTLYVNGTAYTATNPYSGIGSETETDNGDNDLTKDNTLSVTKKKLTLTASSKKQTVKLGAKALAGPVTYSSDNDSVTAKNNIATIKKNFVGTAKITITAGGANSYKKVTATVTITVNPASIKLKTVKNVKTKAAKLTWKKDKTVTGYQIRYSKKKNMGSSKKTKIAKPSTTSTKIKKLTKKKTWYFQIRAYKVVDGKTYYSSWSSKKSVKITK